MSYTDLYLTKSPMISYQGKDKDPVVLVFGVPFDSTCSYRPGTRFGPNAIRNAFQNIEVYSTRYNVDLERVTIEDLGNLKPTMNPSVMVDAVGKVTQELLAKNKQLVVLGGEHLLTFGTLTSMPRITGYVVFDAHYDLRDEYGDMKLTHAAYLRRIIEKRGPANIVHVGARSYGAEELDFKNKMNLKSISDKELRNGSGAKLLKDAISNFDDVYISIDLDVLDSAFAPGVSNPEPFGLTAQQLLELVYALEEKKVKCFDIVELSPPYDNGTTAAMAAKLMAEIICMCMKH